MKKSQRYWELDIVRALALLLMLVQHTWVVWNYVHIDVADSPIIAEGIGKIGAVLFLLLVGVSGYILYHKKSKTCPKEEVDILFLKRGLFLLAMGLVISVATYFAIPQAPIYFGVLSFIGLSIILLPLFIRNIWLRWSFIFVAPVLGYLANFMHPQSFALLPLGIYPIPFQSKDYWPFFPWITLVLAGVIIGESIYYRGDRQFEISPIKSKLGLSLQWIGSHTLLLYMLHLPILYIAILAIHLVLKL